MRQPGFFSPRERGFTLIEIAVVLAIIGLITAGLIALILPVLKATKSRATNANAEAVRISLQQFILRNGRLPCPAIPGPTQTGLEDTSANCGSTVIAATGMARGIVPYQSIGLTADQVSDGQYRRFTYMVTVSATTLNPSTVQQMRGNLTVHVGVPISLGPPNQANSCAVSGDDNNACNFRSVVVLISHGENGFGAFTESGASLPAPTSAAELANTDNDVAVVIAIPSTATGMEFDDSVYAWSPIEMMGSLIRDGSLRSPEAVTQERLNTAAANVFNAMAVAGHAPPAALSPSVQDGWGQSIVYIVDLNGDGCAGLAGFTLRSLGLDLFSGPNPAVANRNDDIVVTYSAPQVKNYLVKANACS